MCTIWNWNCQLYCLHISYETVSLPRRTSLTKRSNLPRRTTIKWSRSFLRSGGIFLGPYAFYRRLDILNIYYNHRTLIVVIALSCVLDITRVIHNPGSTSLPRCSSSFAHLGGNTSLQNDMRQNLVNIVFEMQKYLCAASEISGMSPSPLKYLNTWVVRARGRVTGSNTTYWYPELLIYALPRWMKRVCQQKFSSVKTDSMCKFNAKFTVDERQKHRFMFLDHSPRNWRQMCLVRW